MLKKDKKSDFLNLNPKKAKNLIDMKMDVDDNRIKMILMEI